VLSPPSLPTCQHANPFNPNPVMKCFPLPFLALFTTFTTGAPSTPATAGHQKNIWLPYGPQKKWKDEEMIPSKSRDNYMCPPTMPEACQCGKFHGRDSDK
jgi:hypothetical protein